MSASSSMPQDTQARHDALDVTRSFLVQAPAGSGKTQLLTQRLLALLGTVDEPEEVLAITFTKAATAEMRSRVLSELRDAQALLERGENPAAGSLAIGALERSRERGWSLLEQPQRLNIQTIDSLCLRIAHEAPLLSRLGGQLQPTEEAQPLYALAARRTLEQLGGPHAQLSAAIAHLLRLRDVNLRDCESLIADMLGSRDLWLGEFSGARSLSEDDWSHLRAHREAPLRREHDSGVSRVLGLLRACSQDVASLLALTRQACGGVRPPEKIAGIVGLGSLDDCKELSQLLCLRALLLRDDGEWRQRPGPSIGFAPLKDGGSREHVAEFRGILTAVQAVDGLREALCALESLPNASFDDEEWRNIRAIFTVLFRAAAELRVLFAERSVIDFVEAGITAEHALRDGETRRRWSQMVRHLLVDEFQDTSRRQYTLLKEMVRDWDPAERRTCFLVGDPMQSIYLFRNAELALFDDVRQHGFGADVPAVTFTHLTLTTNFRSDAGIVEPINTLFAASPRPGAARFTPARAKDDTCTENALHLHPQFFADDAGKRSCADAEAKLAVDLVRSHLPALEAAREQGNAFRIGVLVRNKSHVLGVAQELRSATIPYRAVEIETLGERQEVRDLLSLLRALLHPMDRIAWLSVLRAPWCGLSLADLHILSGSDDRDDLQKRPIRELLTKRMDLLSEDGQQRARRVQATLELALESRFSGAFAASPNGFAAWIERMWTALGGPHCIDNNARENVRAFFQLLATFPPDGMEAAGPALDERLERLFAQPDPRAPEASSVQLMTIHKAKGLGFDMVLVPGMHRLSGKDDPPLLRWMVWACPGSAERELLMAPIGVKGGTGSATYRWLAELQKREQRAEVDRLLYVACTRARHELHLFAALKTAPNGLEIVKPSEGTLLACGWQYLEPIARARLSAFVPTAIASEPGLAIAAQAERPTQLLKRLPVEWDLPIGEHVPDGQDPHLKSEMWGTHVRSHRKEGALASRARGVVLHAVFETLAALAAEDPRRDLSRSLAHWSTVAIALLRHAGLQGRELEQERKAVVTMLRTAAGDPQAQWILDRRPYARSESAWTFVDDGDLRTVRCDRVFLAGDEPLSQGESHLWIVDYKTADGDEAFLLDAREQHGPQLRRYAEALRAATGTALPIRLALYFPALPHLLWWAA